MVEKGVEGEVSRGWERNPTSLIALCRGGAEGALRPRRRLLPSNVLLLALKSFFLLFFFFKR